MNTLPMVSAEHLVPSIVERYPRMDASAEGTPICVSVNETYRVIDDSGVDHVLKVYRAGWRSLEQVVAETSTLRYLIGRGAPVNEPVPDRDGCFAGTISATEGTRCYAMYRAVSGEVPKFDQRTARVFGRTAARLHEAGAGFDTPAALGRTLDLDYLLTEPTRTLGPVLGKRGSDWHYLRDLSTRLRATLAAAAPSLEWGFCHGDLHGGNALIRGDEISLFDFEFCGPGFLAYDISVYRWILAIHAPDSADDLWDQFWAGYAEVRPLNEDDRAAVGAFVLVRHLWDLAVECTLAPSWDQGLFEPAMLDRYLSHFRVWEPLL